MQSKEALADTAGGEISDVDAAPCAADPAIDLLRRLCDRMDSSSSILIDTDTIFVSLSSLTPRLLTGMVDLLNKLDHPYTICHIEVTVALPLEDPRWHRVDAEAKALSEALLARSSVGEFTRRSAEGCVRCTGQGITEKLIIGMEVRYVVDRHMATTQVERGRFSGPKGVQGSMAWHRMKSLLDADLRGRSEFKEPPWQPAIAMLTRLLRRPS